MTDDRPTTSAEMHLQRAHDLYRKAQYAALAGKEREATQYEREARAAEEAARQVGVSAAPSHEWDGDIIRCQQCEQRMSVERFFDAEAHACWGRPSMTITEALDAE